MTMPIRFLAALAAILLATASNNLAQGEMPDVDAPVTARLLVKQARYTLPRSQHGERFRDKIANEKRDDRLPPAQRVKLVLELENTSDQPVMVNRGGAIIEPELTLAGPGVVEPESLESFSGSVSASSVQPTIPPGKKHQIEINALSPEGETPSFYWYLPGEYQITATYRVWTNLPPFPAALGGEPLPKGKPKSYRVVTKPVKVQVVVVEDEN